MGAQANRSFSFTPPFPPAIMCGLVVALVWAISVQLSFSEKTNGRKTKTPLITSDFIFGTGELLHDVYDVAYENVFAPAHAKHGPKIYEALDQGLQAVCE